MSLEIFRLSCETIKQGVMLDVDTEQARVVAPGGASLTERRVMRQHRPAASLDCCFDRIHHNLIQYNYYYGTGHAKIYKITVAIGPVTGSISCGYRFGCL